MTPDNGVHVIYLHGKHSVEIFACTVDNAMKLVESVVAENPELTAALATIEAARKGEGPTVCRKEAAVRALKEVATLAEGEPMPKLRQLCYGVAPRDAADERPQVLMKKEWKHAWAIWCVENQVSPDRPEAAIAKLPKDNPLTAFPFFEPALKRLASPEKGMVLVEDYLFDGALELQVLRRNCWKDEAKEARVVSRFVQFLNSWGASSRWDVLPILNA